MSALMGAWMPRVGRGLDRLNLLLLWASAGLIFFIALSIGANVLMRYVFHSPMRWVVEGGEYILLFVTFLSAARLLRENVHARMTLVTERLTSPAAEIVRICSALGGALVAGTLGWFTLRSTLKAVEDGAVYRGSITIDVAALWWVVPFGFTLLVIEFLRDASTDLRALRQHRSLNGTGGVSTEI